MTTASPLLVMGATAASLSPLEMFLAADIVVKLVMVGLALASIWTWGIIIAFSIKLGGVRRMSEQFEKDFWRAQDIEKFHRDRGGEPHPSAAVLTAAVDEWRRSAKLRSSDRAGIRDRLSTAIGASVGDAIDGLSDRLTVLATVGSVAPFVGLFGTVWGIMRSFSAIAAEQNSSLAVVAPGIAEALFATAIGLFAAIPAVIAYNRFSSAINRLEGRLSRYADALYATLSRELEA